MGLRELKARRTRDTIASTALTLFERQGYDATTMEQIAQESEVAPTTLYRYFPSKESILLTQLTPDAVSPAEALLARPAQEDLATALGHVLHERMTGVDAEAEHVLRLRRQIDVVPAARARIWDLGYQEVAQLEEAIARRTGADPDELWVQTTAHSWLMVCQMALDMMRATPEPLSAAEYAAQVIRVLQDGGAVLPRLPQD
jgi:AcrR family transcriptional regulator